MAKRLKIFKHDALMMRLSLFEQKQQNQQQKQTIQKDESILSSSSLSDTKSSSLPSFHDANQQPDIFVEGGEFDILVKGNDEEYKFSSDSDQNQEDPDRLDNDPPKIHKNMTGEDYNKILQQKFPVDSDSSLSDFDPEKYKAKLVNPFWWPDKTARSYGQKLMESHFLRNKGKRVTDPMDNYNKVTQKIEQKIGFFMPPNPNWQLKLLDKEAYRIAADLHKMQIKRESIAQKAKNYYREYDEQEVHLMKKKLEQLDQTILTTTAQKNAFYSVISEKNDKLYEIKRDAKRTGDYSKYREFKKAGATISLEEKYQTQIEQIKKMEL